MRQSKLYLYRGLLFLIFLCTLLAHGLPMAPLNGTAILYLLAPLLPLAVLLWAIGRGSLPGAVLLGLALLEDINSLFDMARSSLQTAGPAATAQALFALSALLRVLALFLFFSPGSLSGCLEDRKARRTVWDLLPEGIMLLFALILSKLPEFLIAAAFWRSIR